MVTTATQTSDNAATGNRGGVDPPADAIMVALSARRIVIVRRDKATTLTPSAATARSVWELQPGDQVMYQGEPETVLAVVEY